MNSKSVIAQMVLNVPQYTDLFSNKLDAVISDGKVKTARSVELETATDHGLDVGNLIRVKDLEFKNEIDSITIDADGVATIELKAEHDYTLKFDAFDIEMDGNSDPLWNKTFTVLAVTSRTAFTITAPTGTAPDPLGYIWEQRDYGANGVVTITEKTDTTFVFDIPENSPDLPVTGESSCRNMEVVVGYRFGGMADVERADKFYTETYQAEDGSLQAKPWLFVIIQDEGVSKDPNSMSDAQATFMAGESVRQRVLFNFDIVLFLPVTSESGSDAVDTSIEIRNHLIKSLVGIVNNEEDAEVTYKTVYNGSSPQFYNTAVYAKVYTFQTPFDLYYENTALGQVKSFALRDALVKLAVGDEGTKTLDIDKKLD